MGLENLLKACWRHRLRLLIGALVGALLVGGLGTLLLKPKYDSSTDIAVAAVFPSSDVNSNGSSQAYALAPDRFVSTQVEILSSRAAAAQVAGKLHLATDVVRSATTVAQLGKSDVIRVTTSTGNASTSAQIARGLAENYVSGVARDTQDQYTLAIAGVDGQLQSLATQTTANLAEQRRKGGVTAANDPLQQRFFDLQSQSSQLTVQRQHLVVQSHTATTATRVVSRATADSAAVGTSTSSLAMYGAILGLALVLCSVALTTTPGRAIDLEGSGDLHGVPILGVLNRLPHGRRLPGMVRRTERAYVRNLRVAGELSRIIQLKGPVLMAVAGGPRSARQVRTLLRSLDKDRVLNRQQRAVGARHGAHATTGEMSTAVAPRTGLDGDADAVTVVSLVSLLQQRPPDQVVVLAVDVSRMTRVDADEVLASLRTFGADILGIVGTR